MMHFSKQIATQFRALHIGGNWTAVNLQEVLADVTWQQATAQVHDLNTIATLVWHTNYYVCAVTNVLQGGPLDAHDKYSFSHPLIVSQADWEKMTAQIFADAEHFASLVEQFQDSKLSETFCEEKYGTWYRNLHGIIEHTHYHLGQIVLIKKLLKQATLY